MTEFLTWPVAVIVILYGLLLLTLASYKIASWRQDRIRRQIEAQWIINEAEWVVAYECIRLGIDNPDFER